MAMLTPSERKKLIESLVKKSKINWAHISIAQLMKAGYIDRVLTTNFDNLVQRACALVLNIPQYMIWLPLQSIETICHFKNLCFICMVSIRDLSFAIHRKRLKNKLIGCRRYLTD